MGGPTTAPQEVARFPRLRRLVELPLSIGAYPEEPAAQRARRRIMVAAIILASLLTSLGLPGDLAAGYLGTAVANATVPVLTVLMLIGLWWKPRWFSPLIQLRLGAGVANLLVVTTLFGGLIPSGLEVLYGLIIAQAALLAFGVRTALAWFAAFLGSVVYALVIPNWIPPTYVLADPAGRSVTNLVAAGIVSFAVTIYFIRQRDLFQRQSDDLLHNILPDEVAARLKASDEMIADSYEEASVLFADVVGFTPMSAGMPPRRLVTLLNGVFTAFDGFVAELGLEKIKTVGDEYMVAAGVPVPRPDHAEAIAELALRIRDYMAASDFEGHRIMLRIGIHSGPVVAGIIGTHKFSYDLWGDTVNTASRMESSGVPGAIQVSAATHDLIRDRFACERRGVVTVKGKGQMETYLLVSEQPMPAPISPVQ
jgi:adenylate cyclase